MASAVRVLFRKPSGARVFGLALATMQPAHGCPYMLSIPDVCFQAIEYLKRSGSESERLFRQSGPQEIVNTLKNELDQGYSLTEALHRREHVTVDDVAALLKIFFRDLPKKLIPEEVAQPMLVSSDLVPQNEKRLSAELITQMRAHIAHLPEKHLDLFRYLFDFLQLLVSKKAFNKIDSNSLAASWAPVLFWEPSGTSIIRDSSREAAKLNHDAGSALSRRVKCTKLLLDHYAELFDPLPMVENSKAATTASLESLQQRLTGLGWVSNAAAKGSQQKKTMPLKWILYRWQLLAQEYLAPQSEPAARAAHAGLTALKDLYQMKDRGWSELRDRVEVGFVRDTEDKGDSSLSMGLARLYYRNPERECPGPLCVFLNCGQGGIKYQLFVNVRKDIRTPSTITSLAECTKWTAKSKAVNLACFSRQKEYNSIARANLIDEMREVLAKGPWNNKAFRGIAGLEKVQIFAFVTSEVRTLWESESDTPQAQQQLEQEVKKIFDEVEHDIHPASELLPTVAGEEKKTYFLTVVQEAQLGMLATMTLYSQIDPTLYPVATLSIGENASQFSFVNSVLDDPTSIRRICYPKRGFNSPDLFKLGDSIVEQLKTQPHFLSGLSAVVRNHARPVIAVRATCLLALSEKKKLELLRDPCAKESMFSNFHIMTPSVSMLTCFVHGEKEPFKISQKEFATVASVCAEVAEKRSPNNPSAHHYLEVKLHFDAKDIRGVPLTDVLLKRAGSKNLIFREYNVDPSPDPEKKPVPVIYAGLTLEALRSRIEDMPETRWKPHFSLNTEKPSIPLSEIVNRWHLVKDAFLKLPKPDSDVCGTHGAMVTLKDLWYMDSPAWKAIRGKVQIGLVKQTDQFGDTSVSMGMACIYFEQNRSSSLVAFLNCGTGGVKYQLYCNLPVGTRNVISLVAEFKPRGCAFSMLEFEGVNPPFKREKIGTDLTLRQQIGAELDDTPWREWKESVAVLAFLTGKPRSHYFGCDAENKALMDAKVAQIFAGYNVLTVNKLFPPVGGKATAGPSESYFIPQQLEGQMELLGCRTMYRQLSTGSSAPLDPLISFGIGEGSTQWCSAKAGLGDDWKLYETLKVKVGMQDPAHVMATVGEQIIAQLKQPSNFENFLRVVDRSEHPTIALKSGCMLLIAREGTEWGKLIRLNTLPARMSVNIRVSELLDTEGNSGPIKPLEVTVPISPARLCAEAAIALDSPTRSFLRVFDSSKIELRYSSFAPTSLHSTTSEPLLLFFSTGLVPEIKSPPVIPDPKPQPIVVSESKSEPAIPLVVSDSKSEPAIPLVVSDSKSEPDITPEAKLPPQVDSSSDIKADESKAITSSPDVSSSQINASSSSPPSSPSSAFSVSSSPFGSFSSPFPSPFSPTPFNSNYSSGFPFPVPAPSYIGVPPPNFVQFQPGPRADEPWLLAVRKAIEPESNLPLEVVLPFLGLVWDLIANVHGSSSLQDQARRFVKEAVAQRIDAVSGMQAENPAFSVPAQVREIVPQMKQLCALTVHSQLSEEVKRACYSQVWALWGFAMKNAEGWDEETKMDAMVTTFELCYEVGSGEDKSVEKKCFLCHERPSAVRLRCGHRVCEQCKARVTAIQNIVRGSRQPRSLLTDSTPSVDFCPLHDSDDCALFE